MSEQEQNTAEKRITIGKIYIKDMSFESPQSPGVFRGRFLTGRRSTGEESFDQEQLLDQSGFVQDSPLRLFSCLSLYDSNVGQDRLTRAGRSSNLVLTA